jgi:5-methylcytosine-specific restriction endonuclease McrA
VKRTPLKRKTPLKPGRPKPSRVKAPKLVRHHGGPGGFPEPVRLAVRLRSGGKCEVKSRVCTGDAAHFHHRKLRRHKDHSAVNCLHACRACHDHIHANPSKAYLMGWLVHEWLDPAEVMVKRGESAS